jgi:hypothetical protein
MIKRIIVKYKDGNEIELEFDIDSDDEEFSLDDDYQSIVDSWNSYQNYVDNGRPSKPPRNQPESSMVIYTSRTRNTFSLDDILSIEMK